MFPIPISSVGDTLSIKHVFEIARYRYRFPALTGLHVGPPLLAFEPKDFTGVQPPDIYELPSQLQRLIIVGLEPSWCEHLLEQARAVGTWAEKNSRKMGNAEHDRRSAGSPVTEPAFAVPQLRMRLNKLFEEMIASLTSVVAFSYATKKRRPAMIAAVMLNGAEVVTEMRRRLDLTEHATLTFLSQKRGWHL